MRDPKIFNIAGDIVINGMIENEGNVKIPSFGIRDKKLEHLSVEEIYEILIKKKKKYSNEFNDLVFNNDYKDYKKEENEQASGSPQTEKEIRAYWKQAINDAKLIAKSSGKNVYPKSFDKTLGEITEPEIDWKIKLWNFLVRTPTDFGDFDRRLIYSGLYLENLEGESINVFCCIDTSASISDYEINKFMSEVKGILNSYPNINLKLWDIEDGKRAAEKNKNFDEKFIELARNVYKFNDERAKIKLAINTSLGSNIKEVKSYE